MTVLRERPSTVFSGPAPHFATAPAEITAARDSVRLLVARPAGIAHRRFGDLLDEVVAGDLLVVNTSATVPGQVDAVREARGELVVVHLATPLDDGSWVVELRTAPDASAPVLDARIGEIVGVAGIGRFRIKGPYGGRSSGPMGRGNRLWVADPPPEAEVMELLARHGRPIAYGYLDGRWPLAAYQHVFAGEPGSAEMASAARPFTESLVTRLVSRGVRFAPVVLHTGVSSQEAGEGPQPERFAVTDSTAALVNATAEAGGRVIGVGTSATRALESAVAAGPGGPRVEARSGWTERVLTPKHPPRVVRGLLTGWHDALASHLLLVESVAGPDLTQRAYDAALSHGYRWHEFGDSCLLLP